MKGLMATKAELEKLRKQVEDANRRATANFTEARQLAQDNEKVVLRNIELSAQVAALTKNAVEDVFRRVRISVHQGDELITQGDSFLRKGDMMNMFVDADGEMRSNVVRHNG